jgi:methionine biosynthesis protein MetW
MAAAKSISTVKRETDLQTISEWIEPGSRVLDIGCGRGVLLEQLWQKRNVKGLGVDIDAEKIEACVKRGVPVYQGDAEALMRTFDDGHFDWVILSRTMQEMENPERVLAEALRVGRKLAVGFANQGYWRNRVCTLLTGAIGREETQRKPWPQSSPENPVGITEFEAFCAQNKLRILHRQFLARDMKRKVACTASLRAAYALYAVSRAE